MSVGARTATGFEQASAPEGAQLIGRIYAAHVLAAGQATR
jgi:hypothetical protein